MGSSIGPIFIPTMAAGCSSPSSTISCTAKTTAGSASPPCGCRGAGSAASSSAPRGSGRPPPSKLDRELSPPRRPYNAHDETQPLEPGQVVELDIEIWPTSVVVPTGHRIGLSIRGKDFEYGGASGGRLSNFKNELRGCGPF